MNADDCPFLTGNERMILAISNNVLNEYLSDQFSE